MSESSQYDLLLFTSVCYFVPYKFPLSKESLATLGTLKWLHTQMFLLVICKILLISGNIARCDSQTPFGSSDSIWNQTI